MNHRISDYIAYAKNRPDQFMKKDDYEIILDKNIIQEYERNHNCQLGLIYQSPYHLLVVDLIKHNNQYSCYERIIPTQENGVVIIPMVENRYILLKQFRHALRDYQLGFPRGFGEQGISAKDNAIKELTEEIQCHIELITYLGEVIPDSGLSNNKVQVFKADISHYHIPIDYEGISGHRTLTDEELNVLIKEHKINDSFTLSAMSILKAE